MSRSYNESFKTLALFPSLSSIPLSVYDFPEATCQQRAGKEKLSSKPWPLFNQKKVIFSLLVGIRYRGNVLSLAQFKYCPWWWRLLTAHQGPRHRGRMAIHERHTRRWTQAHHRSPLLVFLGGTCRCLTCQEMEWAIVRHIAADFCSFSFSSPPF